MNKEYKKIIFADTDNTCTSIMAEAVMKRICKSKNVEICSRGLVVLFSEPVNPKATAVLKGDGLAPAKASTEKLTAEDIDEDTLILAMTEQERRKISEKFGKACEVMRLGDLSGQEGDIPEPYGGTLAQYGACYEYIDFVVKVAYEKLYNSEE